MQPLSGPDLARIRHLFGAGHLALVLEAVLAGTAPARIWVDDATAPRTALVWDSAHCVYLVGAVDDAHACREVFRREIAPAGRGMLKAYTSAAAVFAGYAELWRERVVYRGDAPTARPVRLPPGFQLAAITEGYATLRGLDNFGEVVAEVESCWGSLEAFRSRGFGFCAHDGGAIACWCTAEYVSDGRCGIGIETVAGFQRRGLATACTSAFVEHCAGHGITPYWDAWTTNVASVAVAERIGLGRVESYSILVGTFTGTG